MNDNNRCYHHGNLRDALILATAELLEESGSLAFSITDAARRAGVSNAAPYRHFRDKEDLLDNVRDLAFMGLHEQLEHTRQAHVAKAGSIEAVTAMGHTYLAYVREKQAFFSLMWEDHGQMDSLRQNAEHKRDGFRLFVAALESFFACQPTTREGLTKSPSAVTVATQLWAMAHGLATLEHNKMLDLFDKNASADAMLDASTRVLLAGWTMATELDA